MAAPTTQLAKSAPTTVRRRSLRQATVGYAFILPALLLYIIFFVYPFVVSIYYSFINWQGAGPKEFVGLANYRRLFSDSLLWRALGHNIIWVIVGTAAPIVIALLLGALLGRGVRGMTFFRVIYFLPVVLAEVVTAIIWNWIYHPLFGALNQILKGLDAFDTARNGRKHVVAGQVVQDNELQIVIQKVNAI